MQITLEKIDIVRERTGASYAEAKQALIDAGGDEVEAIIALEHGYEQGGGRWREKVEVRGNELLDKIKAILAKGNATKIIIKHDEKVLAVIPVTAGAVGALIAPQLAAIAAVVCLVTRCTLEIERIRPEEGEETGGPSPH